MDAEYCQHDAKDVVCIRCTCVKCTQRRGEFLKRPELISAFKADVKKEPVTIKAPTPPANRVNTDSPTFESTPPRQQQQQQQQQPQIESQPLNGLDFSQPLNDLDFSQHDNTPLFGTSDEFDHIIMPDNE